MNSRDGNGQVTKEDISASQSWLSSCGQVLRRCLKKYPTDATDCDREYKTYTHLRLTLESQEEQYLAQLDKSIKNKTDQFDKAFDPNFTHPPTVVEQLSEESKALKNKILRDTAQAFKTKDAFERFRNDELKQNVFGVPHYYFSAPSPIFWSSKFSNKEIHEMSLIELHQSNQSIEKHKKAMSRNEKAQYVSVAEISNEMLSGRLKI